MIGDDVCPVKWIVSHWTWVLFMRARCGRRLLKKSRRNFLSIKSLHYVASWRALVSYAMTRCTVWRAANLRFIGLFEVFSVLKCATQTMWTACSNITRYDWKKSTAFQWQLSDLHNLPSVLPSFWEHFAPERRLNRREWCNTANKLPLVWTIWHWAAIPLKLINFVVKCCRLKRSCDGAVFQFIQSVVFPHACRLCGRRLGRVM